MSTAASLASAKKRRGINVNPNNKTTNSLNNNNINTNKNISDKVEIVGKNELIVRHENRIFNLERLISEIIMNKNKNLNLDDNLGAKYSNYIENNKEVMVKINNLLDEHDKTIKSINSSIINLKVSISDLEKKINEIKK
tara:strand:- start:42 stop:458 length:417 start_codon:yes stop_codon:yes gene_type:complete